MLHFLVSDDVALFPVAVKANTVPLPLSFILCPLAALLSIPPLFYLLPFISFYSFCLIFHNPLQMFCFRFINRPYTLLCSCLSLSYSFHSFLFFFFAVSPCNPALSRVAGSCTALFPALKREGSVLQPSHSELPHVAPPSLSFKHPAHILSCLFAASLSFLWNPHKVPLNPLIIPSHRNVLLPLAPALILRVIFCLSSVALLFFREGIRLSPSSGCKSAAERYW